MSINITSYPTSTNKFPDIVEMAFGLLWPMTWIKEFKGLNNLVRVKANSSRIRVSSLDMIDSWGHGECTVGLAVCLIEPCL